jgi:hypothetical protein
MFSGMEMSTRFSALNLMGGMYETENGRYGRSQRKNPPKPDSRIDVEGLKSQIDPHKSVYRTEYLAYSQEDLNSCNIGKYLLDRKNEDHMRGLRMRYPIESSSRTAFKDWTGSVAAMHPPESAKPIEEGKCPFGVLSLSKLNKDTQYSHDFIFPRSFSRERLHRSESRDTFQFCQGGVPRQSSNSSCRSRSVGPSNRTSC